MKGKTTSDGLLPSAFILPPSTFILGLRRLLEADRGAHCEEAEGGADGREAPAGGGFGNDAGNEVADGGGRPLGPLLPRRRHLPRRRPDRERQRRRRGAAQQPQRVAR